jgi:hypothetical protein
MPENKLEAERDEEKPQRKRRLTLMESYGAFSDDRLREVTAKIRDLTAPRPPQDIQSDDLQEPLGEPICESTLNRIGDPIGDSIGTPIQTSIQTPIGRPVYSSNVTPVESPHEVADDSPLGRADYSSLRSPVHAPAESPNDPPNVSSNVAPDVASEGLRTRAAVLLTENQAILYFCLQKINGVVTSLSRIARECRISEHTLKSCLKKLRQEELIIYGGRRNCGGRIGFTAKTIERPIMLRGDKGRLSRRLQQINYQALSFTEALEDTLDVAIKAQYPDQWITYRTIDWITIWKTPWLTRWIIPVSAPHVVVVIK